MPSKRDDLKRIPVSLGDHGYDILIARGLRHRLGALLRAQVQGNQMAIVTHAKIDRLYGDTVRRSLTAAGFQTISIRVPSGERYKTLGQVERIYDRLIRHRFERGATLLALGGGVIGDMTGFAAATFLRGVACVQVPTTVVAQVDASIGGKTGVDHPMGKNLIGVFHQPRQVCIDPDVLTTLPRREFVAGLAEVVKYGVIADAAFFEYLEEHAEALLAQRPDVVAHCIARSAAMKAEIVSADEREAGRRKILNYGHTFGHAVETLTGYRAVKHGEAVAIGMVAAARLACDIGLLDAETVTRQTRLLTRLGLPTTLPPLPPAQLIRTLLRDKKVSGGEVYFVLPEKIGAVRVDPVSQTTLKHFLKRSL